MPLRMIIGLIGWATMAAFGQSVPRQPDPKPDFPPSNQVHISPTTNKENRSYTTSHPDYWIARGYDLKTMIARVYGVDANRLDFPLSLDDGKRYDFALVPPQPESQEKIYELVQQAIQDQFRLTIARQTRSMDVFVLTAPHGKAPTMKLSPEVVAGNLINRMTMEDDHITASGITMNQFRGVLEERLGHVVIDGTDLKGRYDFEVHGSGPSKEDFLQMLRDQLGLILTASRRSVAMLVVSRR